VRPPRREDAITIPVGPLRRLVTLVIVVVVLAALAAFVLAQRDAIRLAFGGTEAAYIDTTTYQSVVLLTNQVYFGKLRIDGDVYLLTDVYQLNASDPSSNTVQVVKRGGELSGPTEPLVIPGRSVLFFENMRNDSQVMNAIRQIRSGNIPPPAQATPARSASPSASR
jgi:hypothetical protein